MSKSFAQKLGLGGSLLLAIAAPGQTVAPPRTAKLAATPVFDVVSIRPNNSGSGSSRWETHDNSFSATNITLLFLLINAYDMRDDQITGVPGWVRSTHFDLQAKVVDYDPAQMKDLTDEQRDAMLQAVLADRFKLKAHIETKTLSVYDLVVAKGGSKLKTAPPDIPPTDEAAKRDYHPRGGWTFGNGKLDAKSMTMPALAGSLAQQLQHTVLDKTALTGEYDLTLNWSPETGADAPADTSAPSIFTAVQEQLGLKLQPSKGPVNILVVDHAEMPSEN